MNQRRGEHERAEQSQVQEYARLEPRGTHTAPAGIISSSRGRDSQQLLRELVASFAELDKLTRENHEFLQEMKRLVGKPGAGTFPSATTLTDADKLQELNRLLAMAKALGDVAVSHTLSAFLSLHTGQ